MTNKEIITMFKEIYFVTGKNYMMNSDDKVVGKAMGDSMIKSLEMFLLYKDEESKLDNEISNLNNEISKLDNEISKLDNEISK